MYLQRQNYKATTSALNGDFKEAQTPKPEVQQTDSFGELFS